MSELMNMRRGAGSLRREFLTGVSALALLGAICASSDAIAADDETDHPTMWIELGGQLEQLSGGEERFAPTFLLTAPKSSVQTISPLDVERPPRFSNGGEGNISFEPDGSRWVFSASVRYGRSNGGRHVHQQSYPATLVTPYFHGRAEPGGAQFSDTKIKTDDNHSIVDFQVGRDVGLGLFNSKGSSIFDLGVRFAQFNSKSAAAIKEDPDWHFAYKYLSANYPHFHIGSAFHSYAAQATASRSFRGLGPSLSWKASAPVMGGGQNGGIALDWGLNAALLFGRQKAVVLHQTIARYHGPKYYGSHPRLVTLYQNPPHPNNRVRSALVPNLGAFAGLTFRYADAKISFGYRGDFFFGAMDGGLDARKSENRGFYGPFASVSVGLGE